MVLIWKPKKNVFFYSKKYFNTSQYVAKVVTLAYIFSF